MRNIKLINLLILQKTHLFSIPIKTFPTTVSTALEVLRPGRTLYCSHDSNPLGFKPKVDKEYVWTTEYHNRKTYYITTTPYKPTTSEAPVTSTMI